MIVIRGTCGRKRGPLAGLDYHPVSSFRGRVGVVTFNPDMCDQKSAGDYEAAAV